MTTLKEYIKETRKSIIAIGFKPNPKQITIIGSGFSISDDGKILSAAHVYNQIKQEHIPNMVGMALIKEGSKGLNRYGWFPLELIKKKDKDDVAVFQLKNYENTLITKLDLGDSEKIDVGEDVYFIGFPYAAQLIKDGFGITLVANKGIVSNVKRDGVDSEHKKNWFIVDAISNPGNSGCPLIKTDNNKVVGIMSISFRIKSKTVQDLDIREPMHICAAKPINLTKDLLQ